MRRPWGKAGRQDTRRNHAHLGRLELRHRRNIPSQFLKNSSFLFVNLHFLEKKLIEWGWCLVRWLVLFGWISHTCTVFFWHSIILFLKRLEWMWIWNRLLESYSCHLRLVCLWNNDSIGVVVLSLRAVPIGKLLTRLKWIIRIFLLLLLKLLPLLS